MVAWLAWLAWLVLAVASLPADAPDAFLLNYREIVCDVATADHHRSLRFQLVPLRPTSLSASLGEFAVQGVLQSIPGHPADFYFYAMDDGRTEAAEAVVVELADRLVEPGAVLAEVAIAHPHTGDVLTATCEVRRPAGATG